MKLELQVVSLELAQKLKELGVKQESVFCWEDDLDAEYLITRAEANREGKEWSESCPSAYTVTELGEMLPEEYPGHSNSQLCIFKMWNGERKVKWLVRYQNYELETVLHTEESDTEADARAKMLVYLLENKLITV